ncbi:hypothetical protein IWW43_001711, partial [Coemansia sp. RSA 1935]
MSAIYIDSTGSFSQHAAQHALLNFRSHHPDVSLDNIHTFRVFSASDFLALLAAFDRVVENMPN